MARLYMINDQAFLRFIHIYCSHRFDNLDLVY